MRTPVQNRVALRASGVPMGSPSSVGTQLGATKLNSRPSKTSKPQPSQAAKTTVHWYPVRSQTRRPPPASDMAVDSIRWAARTGWTAVALAVLFTFIGSSARAQETDLDALMARVLERRNETWKALHDYVLDERERFGLSGPARRPALRRGPPVHLVRARRHPGAQPGQGQRRDRAGGRPPRIRGEVADAGAGPGRTGEKKKAEAKGGESSWDSRRQTAPRARATPRPTSWPRGSSRASSRRPTSCASASSAGATSWSGARSSTAGRC